MIDRRPSSRDAMALIVDRSGVLERQLLRNPGGKTSALETTGTMRPRGPEGTREYLPPEEQLDPGGSWTEPYEIGI